MKLAIMFPPYPPGKIPVTERVLLPAAFMSPFSRLHFTEMQFKKSSQFLASQSSEVQCGDGAAGRDESS